MKLDLLALALLIGITSANIVSDEFIQETNKRIPHNMWKAGRNFDPSTPIEKLRGLLGALEDPENEVKTYRPNLDHDYILNSYDPPTEFDARTQWPQCSSISLIWDQSTCGSCWAFGAASSMSDRQCIHNQNPVLVSPDDLLTCCPTCGFGCNGGYIKMAWNYWHSTGIVSGGPYGYNHTCQPYTFPNCSPGYDGPYPPCTDVQPTPPCEKTCVNGADYESDKTFGEASYNIMADEMYIMEEIQTNGPVEAAFTVYADFFNYVSGVYKHVYGSYQGGHAIRILGWGVEDGLKYWLVANSWNEYWGEEGTFKILRGVNECNIENSVVAGLPSPL